MARSHSVHVVTKAGDLVAAFTVKHELITWLNKLTSLEHVRVQRIPDGFGLAGPLLNAKDFLAGKTGEFNCVVCA